ncbi:apolipoprotein N-acyltransferase, partial [Pseudoxanthomonas sp. SGD-10]
DPYEKYGSLPVSEQLHNLAQLSKAGIQANTEFIIWPETALPEYIDESEIRNNPLFFYLQDFLKPYPNITLITGAETFLTYNTPKTPSAKQYGQSDTYWDSFNTAIAIENSNQIQFHHKSKLVPGVEKMPFTTALAFMKPIFSKFGGTTGGYGYQDAPSVLYSRSGIGLGAAICYESIWGNWISEYIKDGAQLIAVITNDGWWGNTTGKDQHLHYARLRAIENRRWVARSANTGISAFINQRGDIVQQSNWWEPTTLEQEINLNAELTFYTKHPDLIIYPFILIGILGFLFVLTKGVFKRKAGHSQ